MRTENATVTKAGIQSHLGDANARPGLFMRMRNLSKRMPMKGMSLDWYVAEEKLKGLGWQSIRFGMQYLKCEDVRRTSTIE